MASDRIVIAGGGIAGLTVALVLAKRGFSSTVYERAERFEEVGAGLQLSPNATRILRSLGVLDRLDGQAVRPRGVFLRDAASLKILTHVPLSEQAESRWGAPYLVAHRADLQEALLSCVSEEPAITLKTGVSVSGATFSSKVSVQLEDAKDKHETTARLLIGADGVWSRLRLLAGGRTSRFTGHVAFRAVISAEGAEQFGTSLISQRNVTAFLAPGFHLVAYPICAGRLINLVVVTKGKEIPRGWAEAAELEGLLSYVEREAPALLTLLRETSIWTAWPLHVVDAGASWSHPAGFITIGDAAHAMTPYAAQGAAMAIEDAAVLATLAARSANMAATLRAFEQLRKPRIAQVIRRGNFNRFAYHAAGPIAFARNIVLQLKSPESLASDFDWLYGYDAEQASMNAQLP